MEAKMAKKAEAVHCLNRVRPNLRRTKNQVRKRWDNSLREAKLVLQGEKSNISDSPYIKRIIESNILNEEFPKLPDEVLYKIIKEYREKRRNGGYDSSDEDEDPKYGYDMNDSYEVSPKVEIQENSGFDYSDYLEDDNAFDNVNGIE